MKATVEISMYPFHEEYRDRIYGFAGKLAEQSGLVVQTGPTATIVMGDYSKIMECLTELMAWSYEAHGKSVFVTKFLLGYEPSALSEKQS